MMAAFSKIPVNCPFCVENIELPVEATSSCGDGNLQIHLYPDLDPMYEHIGQKHRDFVHSERVARLSRRR